MTSENREPKPDGEHPTQPLTVVVTGGAGFIGSHLARALVDDHEVRVLDDLSTGRRRNVPEEATFVEGSILDPEALRRVASDVDVFFHTAANVSVQRSVDDPLASHAVNVRGTLNVLDCARNRDARVVFSSSAAIYGHPETVPVGETDPKTPTSPYGLEKLSGDHYVRLYHDLYGVETVALRYFNVYGPGHSGGAYSGVIDVFHEQARAGGPLTVDGDGTQTRDFVHVDDVVRANLLAAQTPHVGEAFNVGTGESIEILELARLVRDVVDADVDIVHRDPRPGDIRSSRADVSKARTRLDYASRVPLQRGLRTLLEDGTSPTPDEHVG